MFEFLSVGLVLWWIVNLSILYHLYRLYDTYNVDLVGKGEWASDAHMLSEDEMDISKHLVFSYTYESQTKYGWSKFSMKNVDAYVGQMLFVKYHPKKQDAFLLREWWKYFKMLLISIGIAAIGSMLICAVCGLYFC